MNQQRRNSERSSSTRSTTHNNDGGSVVSSLGLGNDGNWATGVLEQQRRNTTTPWDRRVLPTLRQLQQGYPDTRSSRGRLIISPTLRVPQSVRDWSDNNTPREIYTETSNVYRETR